MKTIWKFELTPDGVVEMPVGSHVLTVQTQSTLSGVVVPFLWALVDTYSSKEKRQFRIYGPGHQIVGDEGRYIGTFQLSDQGLVFHVFEDVRR